MIQALRSFFTSFNWYHLILHSSKSVSCLWEVGILSPCPHNYWPGYCKVHGRVLLLFPGSFPPSLPQSLLAHCRMFLLPCSFWGDPTVTDAWEGTAASWFPPAMPAQLLLVHRRLLLLLCSLLGWPKYFVSWLHWWR